MWRFNLRAVLIVFAWLSVIFALAGFLYRGGVLSIEVGVYIAAVLVGSVIGTVYGAARERPDRNRWLLAFSAGSLGGTAAFLVEFDARGGMPSPMWWITGAFVSMIPACVAACATEILRVLLGRYARLGH